MRRFLPAVAGVLSLSLAFGVLAPPAGADAVTDDAIDWLVSEQESDGGFELANFGAFETPDAALAIATAAQTTGMWSTTEAFDAVAATTFEGTGPSPLDWMDAYAESGALDAAVAAKFIVLVAMPYGLDPTAFDPAVDGDPVDLTAGLDDISPGLYNSFLYGRVAESLLGRHVHQDDLQVICEAQKTSGGGWSFDADPGGANLPDQDTTAYSIMALRSAGVAADDPVLVASESFISSTQETNGAWASFGSDDPNSTALAMIGWLALGNDLSELTADPDLWLRTQQAEAGDDAGRIISPNEGFGLNTFATSQGLQALFQALPQADWLPTDASGGRLCLPAEDFPDVQPTTWFENAARWVAAEDIISGIGGRFQGRGPVSRAHASVWLNKMFGSIGGEETTFPDVPANAWYRDGANFVTSAPNGPIASGIQGQFRATRTLTRGQAVNWLYAAAGSPPVDALPETGFTDQAPWFASAATWAKANGIVNGFADDTFRPAQEVNRAQFAQWLYQLAAEPEAWADDAALIAPTVLFVPPT